MVSNLNGGRTSVDTFRSLAMITKFLPLRPIAPIMRSVSNANLLAFCLNDSSAKCFFESKRHITKPLSELYHKSFEFERLEDNN